MAKRLMTRFDRPANLQVEEDGYPQPCVLGHPWVNQDTLKTIRVRGGVPTDPKGRPLAPTAEPKDMLPKARRVDD